MRSKLSKVLASFMIAWLVLLLAACAPAPATPAGTPANTPVSAGTAESTPAPQAAPEGEDAAASFATSVIARTPIPTPTPSRIERQVDSAAERMGLSGRTFLGLTASDWADLAFSALIIVAGYFLARVLVNTVLKRIAARTPTKLDDEILKEIGRNLRWFVMLLFANFAISGLAFIGDTTRTILNDIVFLLGLVILTSMALGLIRTAASQYKANLQTKEDQDRLHPVVIAVQRSAEFIVLLLALSFGLAHYGANANALYFTILAIALLASLAARDVIADAISGFIILVDQPLRVGDSVLIKELDTWGDVLDIGTRTTRVQTKDNRELIVPNSQVAKSQIVNYSLPNTNYRLQTEIGVAYGIDIDRIRKTATAAVRSVEDVLEEEAVDVFFIEFGDSSRKIRVRWWIASFHNQWPVIDAVNVALESAFEKAQIGMPYETYALRVHIEDDGGKASRPQTKTSAGENSDEHNRADSSS